MCSNQDPVEPEIINIKKKISGNSVGPDLHSKQTNKLKKPSRTVGYVFIAIVLTDPNPKLSVS